MKAMRKIRGLAAVFVLGMLLLLSSGGPAAASEHTKWVGVAQTVAAATLPDGQISGTPVVITQLSANGSGPVTVKVPMSESGFRNLTGLGTPPVTDGKAVWKMDLTGPVNGRAIAHFPVSKLPFQVSTTYELNGKKMWPKNIVGKSGHLKVTYVIKNITTEPTAVTFKNVFGQTEKRTVHVPVPWAAAFGVTFPATFTNLKVPGAGVSGNGNGTVAASWTLFLFDPLGGVRQSVTYQAHVTDAVVPSATLEAQAIPSASLKPLPTVHEPGAPAVPVVTVGGRLAAFQTEFRAKLQQLAAKASTALSELRAVLVPAAQHVSTGAAHLSTGVTNVANGVTKVAGGVTKVAGGVARVSVGVIKVAGGVARVSIGAARVATALSALSTGAAKLATDAGGVSTGLAQRAAEASAIASMVAAAQTRLTGLPAAICTALGTIIKVPPNCAAVVAATPRFRLMQLKLTVLEALVVAHAARLVTDSENAKALAALAVTASTNLAASSTSAKALSARIAARSLQIAALSPKIAARSAQIAALSPKIAALSPQIAALSPKFAALSAKSAEVAATIAAATGPKRSSKHGRTIQPRQVGGGARLDAAVGKLDGAITQAGNQVDDNYAYLAALDVRAGKSLLPAGNASGATAQTGAVVYSIGGADPTQQNIHFATVIGVTALILGATIGLGLYRIRRGWPSSLAPPKKLKKPSSPAPAKA
jgi:putative membrane protein